MTQTHKGGMQKTQFLPKGGNAIWEYFDLLVISFGVEKRRWTAISFGYYRKARHIKVRDTKYALVHPIRQWKVVWKIQSALAWRVGREDRHSIVLDESDLNIWIFMIIIGYTMLPSITSLIHTHIYSFFCV